MINGVDDNTYKAVIQKYIKEDFSDFTNMYAIQQIYTFLGNEYRNEYFYKNTILNKLLLHIHSTRTTTALRELPIGKSKADFVLINGKAVVYEIKTDLDNFERLEDQVNSYYKAFDHVVVVTSIENEKNILSFKGIPNTVGIYLLQKTAISNGFGNPARMMHLLIQGSYLNCFANRNTYQYFLIIMGAYRMLISLNFTRPAKNGS